MTAPFADPGTQPDATIGRAVRWAIATLALLASATIFLVIKNSPPADEGAAALIRARDVPDVVFRDVTLEAGVTFRHYNGAGDEKLLPETMGAGCAFFDFDRDGDQDLLFVNGTDWPWTPKALTTRHTAALYRNDGRGRFEDVTAGSGLDVELYGMGAAVGDYDNDGLPDLFLSAVGGNRLFHNEGAGKFSDVTAAAGVGGMKDDWSTSAAWFDFDNDGDLDLFVCNYARWSRETDLGINYQLPGLGRAYGPPMNFPGSFPFLYRNDGDGRFTDVSASSGVQVRNKATGQPIAKSLGVAPVDLDGDHWTDFIVANDTVQNFVFHNERNGTFKEIGELSGAAFDSFGKVRGAMGIDAAQFQDDDSVAVSIGNFANEMTAFYVSPPKALTFTDEAIARGIGAASRNALTFGVFFFDYDLDGWLDLLTTNGHLDEQIARAQPAQQYRQPAQLFWNTRGKSKATRFAAVAADDATRDLFQPIAGRGSAFADIDGDGDLDVVLTQVASAPILLRNEQKLGHHWVRLTLVGTRSNRDAIGASIAARGGGRTIYRQVMPTRGYLSQSELPVTIGLGDTTRVDEVVVVWPGGEMQKVENAAVDAVTTIKQPVKTGG
jgi:hypothetical protein